MFEASISILCLLVVLILINKTGASARITSTKLPYVGCDAHGKRHFAIITCRFPEEISVKDLNFDVFGIDTNTSKKDFISSCFYSGGSTKCMTKGVYNHPDINNNTATITVQNYCKKFYQFTCMLKSQFPAVSCTLAERENCSSEETAAEKAKQNARPEIYEDTSSRQSHFVIIIALGSSLGCLGFVSMLLICILAIKRKYRRNAMQSGHRNMQMGKDFEEIILLNRLPSIYDSKGVASDEMLQSRIKPFNDWATEKEAFLFNIKHSLAEVSEYQVDCYLQNCTELECECRIYINDQLLTSDGLAETKQVVQLLRRLKNEVRYVTMQLERQQKIFTLDRLKSSTIAMKGENQDLSQTVDSFISETKQYFDHMLDEKDKDCNKNKLSRILKKLLEIDVTCSLYKDLIQQTLNSMTTEIGPNKDNVEKVQTDGDHWVCADTSYQTWPHHASSANCDRQSELNQLHNQVMQLQAIFKIQYANAVDQHVLRSITETKASKQDPDKTNDKLKINQQVSDEFQGDKDIDEISMENDVHLLYNVSARVEPVHQNSWSTNYYESGSTFYDANLESDSQSFTDAEGPSVQFYQE